MSVLDDLADEEVVENPTLRAAYNLAPLHQNEPLHWNYNVNLIGEKIYNKTIHLCELCELPILVYGRMLPCKHIFCFECARKCDKTCGRCDGKVNKVEKSALGTVYVCTHGASKHSTKGCRRTYLSQRDLQSHHAHRHEAKPSSSKQQQSQVSSNMGISGGSTSAASTVQPVPNQLPLTQQQAQQQASQIKLQQQQQIAPRGLLSPSQGGMLTSTPMASQQSPLIPGLGGGHSSSPLVQPSVSPKLPLPQQQGLSMAFPGAQTSQPTSLSADVYRPLELSGIGSDLQAQHRQQLHHPQLQPHQQQGMLNLAPVNTHIPQGNNQSIRPPFGSQHFQMQPQQQQHSLPLIQQMPPTVHQTPMSHQQQQHHQPIHQAQHPLVSASQSLDMYPSQNSLSNPAVSSPGISSSMTNMSSHSRTNVNLITVPIQDEGQYRPLPFVSTSMGGSLGNPPPQTRSNTGGGNVNQQFLPRSLPGSYPSQLNAQDQSIVSIGSNSQAQGLSFNQSTQGNNPQGINFSQAGTRPPMGRGFNQLPGQASGPRVGFMQGGHAGNQPFNPNSLTDTKSFHQGSHTANSPFNQGVPTGVQPFNPSLRMNQLNNMPTGGGRANLSQVVQSINMAGGVRPQGSGAPRPGMVPGVPPGGGNNRFSRFPPGMQPRMGSNQNAPQRPHDSAYNQGPYYN